MVIDLKMCRFDNVPWGFRLVGGADFEVPLTVVKVTEGSLAEQAGMRVGDVIVRINDEPTSNMTHSEVHKVISHCGNNFFLGVLREENIAEAENCDDQPVRQDISNTCSPEPTTELSKENQISELSAKSETISTKEELQAGMQKSEESEIEDKIAEVISGEAEVLKEHNIIGVNFNRIFPKPGICYSSEVLKTLNEEAIKTKSEEEKEKRKWTTFLQKPNRPVPKSKRELEEEQRIEAYKVKIVKQPKPRVAPDRPHTPPVEPKVEIKVESEPEPEKKPESPLTAFLSAIEEPESNEPLKDTEVPNLETVTSAEGPKDENGERPGNEDVEDQSTEEKTSEMAEHPTEQETQQQHQTISAEVVAPSKTEEELLLEKQLADVQKQLMALSTLPSTIQATLDAVTKQLGELLPSFKLQMQPTIENLPENSPVTSPQPPQEVELETEHSMETNFKNCEESVIEIQDEQTTEEITESKSVELMSTSVSLSTEIEVKQEERIETTEISFEEVEQKQKEDERRKLEEELNYKKQKDRDQLKEELQQRLIRDRNPKRPSRAFGPLTPQERPLVLPGGRKWRKPKDAYNDEFIAEILSSQAELIVGTTLGVNFLKYQKPEKKIDLEKSEVYKIIHNLEKPKRGIELRPPKVPAEEDVRSRVVSCG